MSDRAFFAIVRIRSLEQRWIVVVLMAAWLGVSCGGGDGGADPGPEGAGGNSGGSEATGGSSTGGISSDGTDNCAANPSLCEPNEPCNGACESKTRFVVAPDGDGDACSDEDPCSLTTARDAVRTARLVVSEDIVIELLDGDYRLTEPFELRGGLDSGISPHRVTYRARAGASPRLMGGRADQRLCSARR